VIDDILSVADAIVDEGWFNAIGRDNSTRARDRDSGGGGNGNN